MFFSFLPFGIHIHTMNNSLYNIKNLKQYKIVGMLSNQQLLQANARRNDDNPLATSVCFVIHFFIRIFLINIVFLSLFFIELLFFFFYRG